MSMPSSHAMAVGRTVAILASLLLPALVTSQEPAKSCEELEEVLEDIRSAEEIGGGLVQLDNRLSSAAKVSPLELDGDLNDGHVHFPKVAALFQPQDSLDMSIFPIAWLHIPKCGSSLLNALVRIPGACNIPKDLVIADQTMGPDNIAGFFGKYPQVKYCSDNETQHLRVHIFPQGTHLGLGGRTNYLQMWKGKGVTMVRNPEQRLISAYYDNRHSWPLDAEHPAPNNIVDYAQQLQGCMVKMFTRSGQSHQVTDVPNNGNAIGPHWGGPCGEGEPPTMDEVDEAKRRLRSFLFVGLQEEWELSMCLFHATFGGECHHGEFINTRHYGWHPPKKEYNETFHLGTWTDPYDGPFFKEAQRVFWGRFHTLGLSVDACKPCFDQGHYTYVETPDI